MSTNYYLRTEQQTAAGEDGMHLGLSATGIFMFEAHPRRGIVSLAALEQHLRGAAGQIVSEYGESMTIEEFLHFVAVRRKPDAPQFKNSPVVTDRKGVREGMRFRDAEGYLFHNYEFS